MFRDRPTKVSSGGGNNPLTATLTRQQDCIDRREFRRSSWTACINKIYEVDPLECSPPTSSAQIQKNSNR